MMAKELNLTEQQKASLKSIHEAERNEMKNLKTGSLTADEQKAKRQELHKKYSEQAQAVFTPEQKEQMKNMKASMPVSLMTGEPFDFWAFTCGALLARAHARAGDSIRMSSYCDGTDTLDRSLADFAEAYGDQTERDHAELVNAIKSGRVKSVVVDEE